MTLRILSVPHAVIGTTVSGGTSLPELTITFMAARQSRRRHWYAHGSNITDPLLSIGFAAIICPLALTSDSFALTAYLIIPATLSEPELPWP